jgi:outer membrane protein assembly factor BamE (lipoprotein component of BamABCDE complex)
MIAACGLAIILIAGAIPVGPAAADVIKYPESGPTVVQSADTPRRGMSKDQVEVRFGAPSVRQPAVGDPPISSWDYGNFTVYFEGDTVLHSVSSAN